MIRKLRLKFVVICMALVTAMVAGVLSSVFFAMRRNVQDLSQQLLYAVAREDGILNLQPDFHITIDCNAILLPYVIKYNATKPTKFASFPKYKEYVADERYAKIARRVGLCSADTPISEAVDCLVKAIRELMTVTERPLCIKDCGVSEAEFMSKVDELSYKAFEDQCTTANPVYPLVSDSEQRIRDT